MHTRPEISIWEPEDEPAVEHLLDLSFGLGRSTKTSYRLREGNARVPGLSCVVRDADVGIAGAISYWPLRVGHAGTPALLLGPLAVHPQRQNRGIGLQLMETTLDLAKQAGELLVFLVGDQPYYARVGFKAVENRSITLPGPFDPMRLLFRELQSGALEGVSGLIVAPWRYSQEKSP
jgi:predicted N-acetyltransferase YhbS